MNGVERGKKMSKYTYMQIKWKQRLNIKHNKHSKILWLPCTYDAFITSLGIEHSWERIYICIYYMFSTITVSDINSN